MSFLSCGLQALFKLSWKLDRFIHLLMQIWCCYKNRKSTLIHIWSPVATISGFDLANKQYILAQLKKPNIIISDSCAKTEQMCPPPRHTRTLTQTHHVTHNPPSQKSSHQHIVNKGFGSLHQTFSSLHFTAVSSTLTDSSRPQTLLYPSLPTEAAVANIWCWAHRREYNKSSSTNRTCLLLAGRKPTDLKYRWNKIPSSYFQDFFSACLANFLTDVQSDPEVSPEVPGV